MTLWIQPSFQTAAELLVRLGIGSLFVFSGAIKLLDEHENRLRWLRAYQILPEMVVPALALAIPLVELCVGFAFAVGAFAWLSAVAVLVTLGIVTCGGVVTLLRNLRPACGCFGRLVNRPLSWHLVGRNIVLIGAVGAVTALSRTSPREGSLFTFTGLAVVTATLVVTTLIVAGRRFSRHQAREGGDA